MGRGLGVHGVLHQDEEHVPHPAGFHRHQPLALGQLFAGLDGVVQGVAEQGADVQGGQEPPVGKGVTAVKSIPFSRAALALSRRTMSRYSLPVCW